MRSIPEKTNHPAKEQAHGAKMSGAVLAAGTLALVAGGAAAVAPQGITADTARVASTISIAWAAEPGVAAQGTGTALAVGQMEQVTLDTVEGEFSFDQDTITPNDQVARVMGTTSDVICRGNETAYEGADSIDGLLIAVGGDVDNPHTVDLAEIGRAQGLTQQTMGCSCAGNLANGNAVVNVLVSGVTVADLWAMSAPQSGINTVTFTCADGTVGSLPLTYLVQHRAVVATMLNGEDLSESLGYSNQLWIASSSANYYYRDIVAIDFTAEDEAPLSPTFDPHGDAFVNEPSINMRESA